jgi:Uma2 family endonuclease
MALQKQAPVTADAFEAFMARPENADRLFELINGEIIEKMPSNPHASEIAQLIAFFIRLYLREHKIAGHVTDGQGGYIIAGQQFAPDVAYISNDRQPELARQGYNPHPPELAVEVESPSTVASERRLRTKLFHYLSVGTIVWVVYPETQEIEVHVSGKAPLILTINDALDGGDVLPGFILPLKDIFVS